jgi:hypothetical protein
MSEQAPGPLFRTDDQLAEDLRVTGRQLEQIANGLDHLQVLLPGLARAARAEADRIDRIARVLNPPRAA